MKAACCAVLLLGLCVPAHGELRRFHWINQDICRGRQPHGDDFAELKRKGIKTVLDLRGGPIHTRWEKKHVEAAGMHYISIRLSGIMPPKKWQVAEVLKVLEDPTKAPIFVHCWRGADRPSLVIACYRMVHDHWTNQEALAEANEMDLNRFEVLFRRYIRNFNPNSLQPWLMKPAPSVPGPDVVEAGHAQPPR